MPIDPTALDAVKKRRKAPVPAPWTPLDVRALGYWGPRPLVSCDQSLTAAGLVLLRPTHNGPRIEAAITIKVGPLSGRTGWDDLLARTAVFEQELKYWFGKHDLMKDFNFFSVHEMPPTGGGKLMRPEVSLLTAYAFRRATWSAHALPYVPAQVHRALICGDRSADKTAEHAALKYLYPHLGGSELITNAATRDALCVGLTALHRLGEQQ